MCLSVRQSEKFHQGCHIISRQCFRVMFPACIASMEVWFVDTGEVGLIPWLDTVNYVYPSEGWERHIF